MTRPTLTLTEKATFNNKAADQTGAGDQVEVADQMEAAKAPVVTDTQKPKVLSMNSKAHLL